MSNLDNIVKEFLVESYENLDQLDRDLVALEQNPQDCDRLASIFRTIHTIKGTCGFFGFSKLEGVTHVGENLLSRLRDGELLLDQERTSALLSMVDAVRDMLEAIEQTGQDGDNEYPELIEVLTRLQESNGADVTEEVAASLETETVEHDPSEIIEPEPTPEVDLAEASPEAQPVAPLLEAATPSPAQENTAPQAKQTESRGEALAESSIRVDVSLLDKLMNLVGELVLARNQILQFTTSLNDTAFLGTSQRLNLVTTELQEGVMKTRMQPIGNVWSRFPRVVRDLASTCGKKVRVEMEGKETDLDKTIIEAIKDPLTHIVRNSVDHGIETPEARAAAGKPEEGRLFMRAFHEGGQVNIEISDDGGGIHAERVKQKAVDRGLITPEHAARMTERECWHLIFMPGFSTAAKISNVSGRGVGMDVVKTNIEKIGGTVDIHSRAGEGTTVKIKIPLTLAIIPALIVSTGGDRYAIPQVSLLELVRLEGEQAKRGIEMIHGAPVYRLRGNLLPLVYLDHELEIEREQAPEDASSVNIVVLQADDRQFGLVVEGINDTEEIVVKPLGQQLKGVSVFAGATIMGDGKVALILDVLGIAQRAGVVSEVRDRRLAEQAETSHEIDPDLRTLLLFGLGNDRRMAIPLSEVARLEEIPSNSLENADGQEVVQYRGNILPLIRLSNYLGTSSFEEEGDSIQVIVYSEGGASVGLVVDQIQDIVEAQLKLQRAGSRPGLLGSTVIHERVTDLLDVRGIIQAVDPTSLELATTC